MNISEFDFDLPPEHIAQYPPADRGTSRLLVLERQTGEIHDTFVDALPTQLRSGDLLVVNNTRVFPARLIGHREPSGGHVECLLIQRVDDEQWDALVHPGHKLKPGARVQFGAGDLGLSGEILERRFHGRRIVRLLSESGRPVDEVIDAIGHVPLPPYIKRQDEPADRERYQTVFATRRGSVAAPTAGLHLTPAMLGVLQRTGVEVVEITLHVGYGTFKPVRTERIEEHTVDPERFEIAPAAASALSRALDEGRRIVAVGTTTTRTLETAVARGEGRIAPGSGETDLVIVPGYHFRAVSGLLTNFHLPRSSLLLLAAAFAGREALLAAYRHAIERGYRFYSYGDAMLIL
jgi:S-adenosylmethionine:tRNA ribosyltransferase-isomerase